METYGTLLMDKNHWLFEITASVVQDVVILIVLAIVWPKIRAAGERLHVRFDRDHKISHHADLDATLNGYFARRARDPQYAADREVALAELTALAVEVPVEAPAKITYEVSPHVSYNHDDRLLHDQLEARIELVNAGAEIPAWLYEDGDDPFYNSFW